MLGCIWRYLVWNLVVYFGLILVLFYCDLLWLYYIMICLLWLIVICYYWSWVFFGVMIILYFWGVWSCVKSVESVEIFLLVRIRCIAQWGFADAKLIFSCKVGLGLFNIILVKIMTFNPQHFRIKIAKFCRMFHVKHYSRIIYQNRKTQFLKLFDIV